MLYALEIALLDRDLRYSLCEKSAAGLRRFENKVHNVLAQMALQMNLCLCAIFEVKYHPLVLVDRDGLHRFPPTLVTVGAV